MKEISVRPKQDCQIAISVADNHGLGTNKSDDDLLKRLVIELSRLIINSGGKIIYGGKLDKGGFSELLRDFSNQYAKELNKNGDLSLITNYLAWPYYNKMSDEERNNFIQSPGFRLIKATPSVFVRQEQYGESALPNDINTRFLLATSMTAMRHQAENNANARILVGGKTTGFSGSMPGIMEELLIALNHKHPVYLIGGFAGAAGMITRIIEKIDGVSSNTFFKDVFEDSNYKTLLDYYKEKGMAIDYTILDGIKIEGFDNGLSVEQNLKLFHSDDIEEIVSLVLLGLKSKSILS